jgi:hypothetical protein
MKSRSRARCLKQRMLDRVKNHATEEELFAAVREHLRRRRDKLARKRARVLAARGATE